MLRWRNWQRRSFTRIRLGVQVSHGAPQSKDSHSIVDYNILRLLSQQRGARKMGI